ncbi:hypothetical protein IMSAGC009_03908 [Lachnospiraceae bacterium]|nr:hypothetical protein IMSAGC009_03908 [Lachnospiraceae bacterium]
MNTPDTLPLQREEKKYTPKRLTLMLVGILLIGMCVASYRISGFGVDAFSCMNLGISGFLKMSFGNWQLIMNAALLIIVWFTVRNCIGPGTIVNMVLVGYTADFLCWLFLDQLHLSVTMPLRILFLLVGTLLASLGCACYMIADMGIAPYDSVAFIITKYTKEKISFRLARVMSDLTVILAGVIFCMMAGNSIWQIVGLGTIVNACFNGPLIQFFRERIEDMLK